MLLYLIGIIIGTAWITSKIISAQHSLALEIRQLHTRIDQAESAASDMVRELERTVERQLNMREKN